MLVYVDVAMICDDFVFRFIMILCRLMLIYVDWALIRADLCLVFVDLF